MNIEHITSVSPSYSVAIDWAPAYELVMSLSAFGNKQDHKILDLGPAWVREVRQRLPQGVLEEFSDRSKPIRLPLALLIRQCSGERSVEAFLHWLAGLSTGDLYELIIPHLREIPEHFLADPRAEIEYTVQILRAWDEHYFRHIDPRILTGLAADAAEKRRLADSLAPHDLLELATAGLDYRPDEKMVSVWLVPQYHYSPWNVYDRYRTARVYLYPADVLPVEAGEPPRGIMRLTRALSDASRLRILRLLASGEKSFTQVARASRISKSTVHHHMVILRAAGLVCVHESDDNPSYSLRLEGLERLGAGLRDYLMGEQQT